MNILGIAFIISIAVFGLLDIMAQSSTREVLCTCKRCGATWTETVIVGDPVYCPVCGFEVMNDGQGRQGN